MAKAEVHESAADDEVVLDLDLDPHWEKVHELEETAKVLRAALLRLGGTDPGPTETGRLLAEFVEAQDRASDALDELSELTRALASQLRRATAASSPVRFDQGVIMTVEQDKDERFRALVARARRVRDRLRAEGRIEDADELDDSIQFALEITGRQPSCS